MSNVTRVFFPSSHQVLISRVETCADERYIDLIAVLRIACEREGLYNANHQGEIVCVCIVSECEILLLSLCVVVPHQTQYGTSGTAVIGVDCFYQTYYDFMNACMQSNHWYLFQHSTGISL